jgi:hypothetical protein
MIKHDYGFGVVVYVCTNCPANPVLDDEDVRREKIKEEVTDGRAV